MRTPVEFGRHTAEDIAKISSLPGEEWRQIPGVADGQLVSSLGRLARVPPMRQVHKHRPLWTPSIIETKNPKHYPYTTLRGLDGWGCSMSIHVAVARAFLGPPPFGMEIDHINGDRHDARLANLEYVTHMENVRRGVALKTARILKACAAAEDLL